MVGRKFCLVLCHVARAKARPAREELRGWICWRGLWRFLLWWGLDQTSGLCSSLWNYSCGAAASGRVMGLGARTEGNVQGRAGCQLWNAGHCGVAGSVQCQLSLFSSPDLFAIHADSTHGCGLSPVLEHVATRSWNCVLPAWMDQV